MSGLYEYQYRCCCSQRTVIKKKNKLKLSRFRKRKIHYATNKSRVFATGGRSGNDLNIMQELDFKFVSNIFGGIINWKSKGLPTTE